MDRRLGDRAPASRAAHPAGRRGSAHAKGEARPRGPRIWIGGSGPTALREAARFDAWFPTGPNVEFFSEHFPRIRAAAQAAGRKPDAVTGAAYVTLALDASPAAAEQRLHQFLETYYAAPARAL